MKISKLSAITVLILLVLISSPASAQVPGEYPFGKADAWAKGGPPFSGEGVPIQYSNPGTGNWNSPSTWLSGTVPGPGVNVVITSGSTVIIDTETALVGNDLFIGAEEGGAPAILTFAETAPYKLQVNRDITIHPNGTFATGGGNVTDHLLTVYGNLNNNGTLDFSTNNNAAGAGIVFAGATDDEFGGTGPVSDVRKVVIDQLSTTLEFKMSNFTVQGSTIETPASGFLTLTSGTLKISGTFSGSHRTFAAGNYTLPVNGGLWLNNPNYTIEGQTGSVALRGKLRVTAGAYNIGAEINDSLTIYADSTVIVEGGSIGTAGRFSVWARNTRLYYTQTGGTVITCKAGQTSGSFACFDLGEGIDPMDLPHMSVLMSGGDIVIQNAAAAASGPRDFRNKTPGGIYNITGTGLVIGNEDTSGPSNFGIEGYIPNLLIDTVAGGHTVKLGPGVGPSHTIRDVEIGPGGTLDIGTSGLAVQGNRFVNNGTLKANDPGSYLVWYGIDNNPTYSGTGVSTGIVPYFYVYAPQLVLDPAANNIRARRIYVTSGNIINANKLILGNNDAITSEIVMGDGIPRVAGSFDTSPVFELGTGGQSVSYLSSFNTKWVTGPEINPERTLVNLTYDNPPSTGGPLVIDGGDITVTGSLNLSRSTIETGDNKIIHSGNTNRQSGWVDGTLERPYTAPGVYTYHVGAGGVYSPVTAIVSELHTNPSRLSVKAVDSTLPGIFPQFSASRFWTLIETSDLAAQLQFKYDNSDINGDESAFVTWRGNGGPPVFIAGSTVNTGANVVTSAFGITELTGDWGLGIAPVSVSGRVLTAGGAPIRNAVMTLSGGNLTVPRVIQTGNFGTYIFDDLRAGETYTLRIGAKRYRFPQLSWEISPQGNITDLDFVANRQE